MLSELFISTTRLLTATIIASTLLTRSLSWNDIKVNRPSATRSAATDPKITRPDICELLSLAVTRSATGFLNPCAAVSKAADALTVTSAVLFVASAESKTAGINTSNLSAISLASLNISLTLSSVLLGDSSAGNSSLAPETASPAASTSALVSVSADSWGESLFSMLSSESIVIQNHCRWANQIDCVVYPVV